MASHYPYEYEPISAESIIERYNEIIDYSQAEFYSDYSNYIYFNRINKATLRYKPIMSSFKLYINGINYELNNDFYTVNPDTRVIEWKFTKENGGFDIEDGDRVLAVYDVAYIDNDLNGYEDIVLQPNN